jgi:tetratricopeptide (TPR) repeat protein
MRYDIAVPTAARFVSKLYSSLAAGCSLARAAAFGRRRLSESHFAIDGEAWPVQDWSVPLVYEACSSQSEDTDDRKSAHLRAPAVVSLPPLPDCWVDRDAATLTLDRAFDNHRLILLHELVGCGKSAFAAAFAGWHAQTGGTRLALFTNWREVATLAEALQPVCKLLGYSPRDGIAADDALDHAAIADLLGERNCLWIWDNAERLCESPSASSDDHGCRTSSLLAFVRCAAGRKVNFLLISRRDDSAWWGRDCQVFRLAPMPSPERWRLAAGIWGGEVNRAFLEPLVTASRGNPLTLAALVEQAKRDRLTSPQETAALADLFERGRAALASSEGHAHALFESLESSYASFDIADRRHLSLLHAFPDYISAFEFSVMLADESLFPQSKQTLAECYIDTARQLLTKASRSGLLTVLTEPAYATHPALSWLLRRDFDTFWGDKKVAVELAFVRAASSAAAVLVDSYEDQTLRDMTPFMLQHRNLCRACDLAAEHHVFDDFALASAALFKLYEHEGEWTRIDALFERATAVLCDGSGAMVGRENAWEIFNGYRVWWLMKRQRWPEASAALRAELDRGHSGPGYLCKMGNLMRQQNRVECVDAYLEGIRRSDDPSTSSALYYNLSRAYLDIEEIRDIDRVESCLRRAIELKPPHDRHGRAICWGQLGKVAYIRFERTGSDPPQSLLKGQYLAQAIQYYEQDLALLPATATEDLAVAHSMLGWVWQHVDVSKSLRHFHEAIRRREVLRDSQGAAEVRLKAALVLLGVGRLSDAALYARVALQQFQEAGFEPDAWPVAESRRILDLAERRNC